MAAGAAKTAAKKASNMAIFLRFTEGSFWFLFIVFYGALAKMKNIKISTNTATNNGVRSPSSTDNSF